MRCGGRPFYGDTAASAPHLDADRARDGVGGQRQWHKGFSAFDGHARPCGPYRYRLAATLSFLDPPVQHGRVESARQGHGRNGDARLLARADRFLFKMHAINSTTATTGLDRLFYSIHVNAYLLRLSEAFHLLTRLNRCLHQPLTIDRLDDEIAVPEYERQAFRPAARN